MRHIFITHRFNVIKTREMVLKNKNFYILLIAILFLRLNSFGQSRCDTTKEEIMCWTEKMPVCDISLETLENKLNQVLKPQNYQIENGSNFGINFIVNCKGEDFNYEIHRLDCKEFNEKLIAYWKEYTNWTAGEFRGEKIDISVGFGIEVNKNSLKILGKRNWEKQQRKNRNK